MSNCCTEMMFKVRKKVYAETSMQNLPPCQTHSVHLKPHEWRTVAQHSNSAREIYNKQLYLIHWYVHQGSFAKLSKSTENGVMVYIYSKCFANTNISHVMTHLTPATCTPSSFAHSSRCLQSFRVQPKCMAVSSCSQQPPVDTCSSSLKQTHCTVMALGMMAFREPTVLFSSQI